MNKILMVLVLMFFMVPAKADPVEDYCEILDNYVQLFYGAYEAGVEKDDLIEVILNDVNDPDMRRVTLRMVELIYKGESLQEMRSLVYRNCGG